MPFRKKWLWLQVVLLLSLCAIPILTTGAKPAVQSNITLRIGFIEGAGAPGDLGVRLAVDQINRSGGIASTDGNRYRLELTYALRPPLLPEDIPGILDQLRSQGVIAIIGPSDNELALPNLEALARAGIPILTLATSDTLTDIDVTNNIMRMQAAERYYSFGLADVLLNDRNFTRIALIQTDIPSTEALLIFETVLQSNNIAPVAKIQRLDNSTLPQDAAEILQANPEAVVMWGSPQDAATLLQTLRAGNFQGVFAYRYALEAVRDGIIPNRLANGVLGVTSWAYTTPNDVSRTFLLDFVTAYNRIPSGVEAAAYDSVWMLRRQIEATGPEMPALYEGLLQTPSVIAVQGRLNPQSYGNGDFARHVTIYSISELGGPRLIARYANNERLSDSDLLPEDNVRIIGLLGTLTFTPSPSFTPSITPIPSETPIPSATPNRVEITVTRPIINVRNGPSTDFEKIGELNEGDRLPVIGTNQDFTWFVIPFRGGQGWVSADIVEVFDPGGQLVQLPILQPMGFTTPGAAIPPVGSVNGVDLVIENVTLTPAVLVPNQPFTAQVNIRNLGNAPAGGFVVSAIFEPGSVPASTTIVNIQAGSTTSVTLSATVVGTGSYTVGVTVDSSNIVPETNEINNVYSLVYRVDNAVIAEVQSFMVPLNSPFNLAGETADLLWTGSSLDAQNGALVGIISNVAYENVTFSMVDPAIITQTTLSDGQIQSGVVIGVVTAEGRRGVLRVDGRTGTNLTASFRVYAP